MILLNLSSIRLNFYETLFQMEIITIPENVTVAGSLKYLSNFWRSLEMLLINCKVKLKFWWTEYCVLAAAVVENDSANSNNIMFTIKGINIYVAVVTLSAKDNQKL